MMIHNMVLEEVLLEIIIEKTFKFIKAILINFVYTLQTNSVKIYLFVAIVFMLL